MKIGDVVLYRFRSGKCIRPALVLDVEDARPKTLRVLVDLVADRDEDELCQRGSDAIVYEPQEGEEQPGVPLPGGWTKRTRKAVEQQPAGPPPPPEPQEPPQDEQEEPRLDDLLAEQEKLEAP